MGIQLKNPELPTPYEQSIKNIYENRNKKPPFDELVNYYLKEKNIRWNYSSFSNETGFSRDRWYELQNGRIFTPTIRFATTLCVFFEFDEEGCKNFFSQCNLYDDDADIRELLYASTKVNDNPCGRINDINEALIRIHKEPLSRNYTRDKE